MKKDYKYTEFSSHIGWNQYRFNFPMYIFPYVYDLFQEHNHVPLLSRNLELNKELIFLSNTELNDKIIENRPILQRQILKSTKITKQWNFMSYFEEQKNYLA